MTRITSSCWDLFYELDHLSISARQIIEFLTFQRHHNTEIMSRIYYLGSLLYTTHIALDRM